MTVTVEAVQAALSSFIDPNTQKDYVSTRSVKNLKVEGGKVTFDIELGYPAKTQIDTPNLLRHAAEQAGEQVRLLLDGGVSNSAPQIIH